MVQAAVQASGFVGTGLALGCGENRGLCGGASFTAGGHLMVVGFRMRSGAQRTEGSLKQADPGIRTMPKSPAVSALSKADAFLSGGDN